jgi:hypothetical protein
MLLSHSSIRDSRAGQEKLTHGYGEQADSELDTSDNVECPAYAKMQEPVVRTPCESETKKVLEHQETRECLHSDLSCFKCQ